MSLPTTALENVSGTEESRWFATEIQPHEPALRAWLRSRFPTLLDIDDLVQETYARLFRARKAGRIGEARPYLFATARNTAADICRRRRILPVDSLAEIDGSSVVSDVPGVAESVARDQELAMLAEAISVLPKRCRQILTLRKLHGLSHREIARQLGISENTVNAQAALGVLRCREYLRNKGVELKR